MPEEQEGGLGPYEVEPTGIEIEGNKLGGEVRDTEDALDTDVSSVNPVDEEYHERAKKRMSSEQRHQSNVREKIVKLEKVDKAELAKRIKEIARKFNDLIPVLCDKCQRGEYPLPRSTAGFDNGWHDLQILNRHITQKLWEVEYFGFDIDLDGSDEEFANCLGLSLRRMLSREQLDAIAEANRAKEATQIHPVISDYITLGSWMTDGLISLLEPEDREYIELARTKDMIQNANMCLRASHDFFEEIGITPDDIKKYRL